MADEIKYRRRHINNYRAIYKHRPIQDLVRSKWHSEDNQVLSEIIQGCFHLQDLHEPGDAGDPAVTPIRKWMKIFIQTPPFKAQVSN